MAWHRGARPASVGLFAQAVVLTTACAAAPAPRQISHSSSGAYEAALTTSNDAITAAWYDTRHGAGEIYVRQFDRRLDAWGPERRVTNDTHEVLEPSIDATADGTLAMAWYAKAPDGSTSSTVTVLAPHGAERWQVVVPGPSRNPVVRTDGRDILAAWIRRDGDGESVWLARWSLDGKVLRGPLRVGAASSTTWNVNLALGANGAAWVAFDAVSGTRASELFVGSVDAETVSLVRVTADDGHDSKYPDLAMIDDRAVVTWFDVKDGNSEVYLFAGVLGDLSREIETRAQRVTETAGESMGAYAAWNGNRIGLAWCDDSAGQHEIYFQPFDAAARPLAGPTRVTNNSTSSLVPAIEPWRSGFSLAWNEFVPESEEHGGKSEIAFALLE